MVDKTGPSNQSICKRKVWHPKKSMIVGWLFGFYGISTQFSSIWPIDRALSGATTLSLSGPWSDGNKGVICILQSSSITETSLSDCLVLYPGCSLEEGILPLCRDAVGVFYSPNQLGKGNPWGHGTDTCWGLPFLCNCKEVGCGIQVRQKQHRKRSLISLSKNLTLKGTS